MNYRITDDIDKLMAVLPPYLVEALEEINNPDELVEVVMDLGRLPTARYVNQNHIISDTEVDRDEIDYVVSRLGGFDADNRGGIERTLHRISAIRNRAGEVVGLTCRVGRAVYGTLDIIEDIINSRKNVLLLGAPGVGKTTMLREAARVLADAYRVVIVDTSNEIGGDGDVPHPAIGQSRRMQVAQPTLQHEVMIEAVENHNPQVIVIDEIGRELEARAARTIAERGVQLIGTAHGNTLENLLRNPTLSDLVGGVQVVTLSDEEARRRRTQKTVLERRAPPTFDILIEIQHRQQMVIHEDIASAVDALLRGYPQPAELRYRDENDQIHAEPVIPVLEQAVVRRSNGPETERQPTKTNGALASPAYISSNGDQQKRKASQAQPPAQTAESRPPKSGAELPVQPKGKRLRIYAYGVAHNRLLESADKLGVLVDVIDNMMDANVLVTVKSYYRRRPKLIIDAERRNIPIHVLRANTESQVENFLTDVFQLDAAKDHDPLDEAMDEVRHAIMRIQSGEPSADLKPQAAHIRRRQHDLARAANLASHSYGREPKRYVRIFRDEIN